MSKSIERIVRPFQLNTPFTSRLPPALDAAIDIQQDAILVITSKADTEYINEPPPAAMDFQVEWIEDKGKRITEKVRVENPDDSSQFVQIERIKSMTLRNTKTGEQLPMKMDWGT